jgi:hypothetical protein
VQERQLHQLTVLLQGLDTSIPRGESLQLSKDIFDKTGHLTKEFELTKPALWHNFLVNVGVKEKGLCYHWSDALYLYLHEKKYVHFSFHLVGADIGEYFFEHNALVIVTKNDCSVEDGILIDPWRDSGNLYFSKLKEDTLYQWKHRRKRECFSL